MWSLDDTKNRDLVQLLRVFTPGTFLFPKRYTNPCPPKGKVLVRFYGDHSSSWVRPVDITDDGVSAVGADADEDDDPRVFNLKAWGRANNKCAPHTD